MEVSETLPHGAEVLTQEAVIHELKAKEKSARLGSPKAKLFIKLVKELGMDGGQVEHLVNGIAKLTQLADPPSNNADAQCVLGIIYEEGAFGKREPEKGLVYYQRAADQEHSIAQCMLGVLYDNGQVVPQDMDKALRLYQAAAAQNNPAAQCNIGILYDNGIGVDKDKRAAIRWYILAATQDYASAEYNLGYMYLHGEDGVIDRDLPRAMHFFSKAAAKGHANAKYNLGWMYLNGEGTPPDEAKAFALFEALALEGDANAQCQMGWMYETGRGKKLQDESVIARKAAEWYVRKFNNATQHNATQHILTTQPSYSLAAVQNEPIALGNLGLMYVKRRGIEKDMARAVQFHRLAAKYGSERAKLWLESNLEDFPFLLTTYS